MRKRPHPKPHAARSRQRTTGNPGARTHEPDTLRAELALAQAVALDVVTDATSSRLPADRLLKDRLREARLSPDASGLAVKFVFSWFRWRGFLKGATPAIESLMRALDLAAHYAEDPEDYDEAALIDGAVPGWLHHHMDVNEGFVRALQSEPVMWLRSRPGQAHDIEAQLHGARADGPKALRDALRFTGEDNLFHHPLFEKGRFEIQDIASQAVGAVCAPAPGQTWWDACAGEGGKTLHLADLMHNRGLIWASDRSAARLGVLRKRAARAGIFNYRAVPWDGGPRPPTRTRFDGVLVDAPCSGVGTWQRNPHARWTVGPADVRELAAVQARVLDCAAGSVKSGGRLVYAVCTLTRDETSSVADAFEKTHPDFEPDVFFDPFATDGRLAARALWEPQHTRGNGMFVAAWRRISR